MDKLSDAEIETRLANTEGWRREGDTITRTFTLPGFPAALVFTCAVGQLAERRNHHPDILIKYRNVTLTLSTHDAGGLTVKDFELADDVNAIAS